MSVAERGSIVTIRKSRQVWLNLHSAWNHVWDPRRPDRYDLTSNSLQRILLSDKTQMDALRYTRSFREMNLRELIGQEHLLRQTTDKENYNIAWVEIHKKFSIPFACIVFGIVGLPLGITNRRGGKSSGFSLSIAIVLFYWVAINNGEALAGSGKISPFVGMWAANIVMLVAGIYLMIRASRDIGATRPEGSFSGGGHRDPAAIPPARRRAPCRSGGRRRAVDPQPARRHLPEHHRPLRPARVPESASARPGLSGGAVPGHRLHRACRRHQGESHRLPHGVRLLPFPDLPDSQLDAADLRARVDAGDVRDAVEEQRSDGDEVERRFAVPGGAADRRDPRSPSVCSRHVCSISCCRTRISGWTHC